VKQNLFARVAVCILLFLAISAAFAYQMPQPFSADMTTTSANGNLNMSGKMYISMPRMRMDMNNAGNGKAAGPFGGKASMIVDGTTKTMYMLMPEQHMYMEFPMDQNSPMTQRMPKFQDMFKGNDPCAAREGTTCKKLGTETVNGRSCDKWEITEKSGKTETLWMDQKLHFPIKSVVGEITTQYTNIKEGAQDASLFKIPDGYRKMDMGNMQRPPR
jgi:hypothetical protein